MKKFFSLLALLTFSVFFKANASHAMGGDMTIQLDTPSGNYVVTLSIYRDTKGIPLPSSVDIWTYTYNPISGQYDYATTYTAPKNTTLSTALLPSFPYGVEVGIYTTTISLTTNKYRFVHQESARNAAIANCTSPGSQSLVVYTDLEVFSSAPNSSPECLTMPMAYFPIHHAAYYNPLPYDVDGDSLAWSLNTPIGDAALSTSASPSFTVVPGFTTPPGDAGGAFAMNSYTGEITWTPSTLGNFIQSFKIDEYRGGTQIGTVIRDMQYVIIPDTASDSLWCSAMTGTMYDTTEKASYIYYTPGKELTYEVTGHCLKYLDHDLVLNAYGGPFVMANPATFTSVASGATITGTLKWTPPAGLKKDIIAVFRLTNGTFSIDQTMVLRKDPTATAVATVAGDAHSITVYPNPAHNSINISLSLDNTINSDISLYSVLGQKVQTIYSGNLTKGVHQLSGNVQVAPGVYSIIVRDNGTIINTQHVVIE